MALFVGAATRVINCEIGDDLMGQLHRRFCERIRDDLEANFFYLATDEGERILLVNLDLAGGLETAWVRATTARLAAETGVPARSIILTSTHTHDGPDTISLLHDSPRNDAYLARLADWLADGVREAVAGARPARVGWARGEAHVGFNRRLCWQDGSHSMYGDSHRPDFAGLEGPDDPSHAILYAVDEEGRLLALLHNNCCHATCLESASFASADFPGEARRLIREALGEPLPVLYLQGASGDTSPWNMEATTPHYSGEQRVREIGALLAAETLRLLRATDPVASPILRHAYTDLPIAVRLPNAEQLRRAEEIAALGEEKAGRGEFVLAVCGTLRLQREFGENPVDTLAVHALRVGDLAIATNPCELYCQFGLDIKRRSPAPVTMVAQLSDGFSGYCPTVYGVLGGGYSGDPTYWTRLEIAAGYRIVDASARLLHRLWRE